MAMKLKLILELVIDCRLGDFRKMRYNILTGKIWRDRNLFRPCDGW